MQRIASALAALLVLAPLATHAGDGTIEINQACALAGCGPTDAPGFPVDFADGVRRSLRLTSTLVVASANAHGIVLPPGSTLDLNGFAIRGPATCTGTPVTSCAPSGSGKGIVGTTGHRISAGTIEGFASYGIDVDGGEIRDVIVANNGGRGIQIDDGSVLDSIVSRNGSIGIEAFNNDNALQVRGCIVRGNGGYGVFPRNGTITDSVIIDNALSGAGTVSAVARSYFRDNNGGGSQVSGDKMTCLVVQGVRSCP